MWNNTGLLHACGLQLGIAQSAIATVAAVHVLKPQPYQVLPHCRTVVQWLYACCYLDDDHFASASCMFFGCMYDVLYISITQLADSKGL